MSHKQIKHYIMWLEMDCKAIAKNNSLTALDMHRLTHDIPHALKRIAELSKPWYVRLGEWASKTFQDFIDAVIDDHESRL